MPTGQIIDPNLAAQAYTNSTNIGQGRVAGRDEASFADFMKKNITSSIDTLKSGETMAARAVTEEADLTDVVEAVTAAELTLQTVVSVRDRLISTYQEIMRMPM